MSNKQEAIIVKCSEDQSEHAMKDNCLGCAPFWYYIPTCPSHQRKLKMSGYCKDCKKYYKTQVGERNINPPHQHEWEKVSTGRKCGVCGTKRK